MCVCVCVYDGVVVKYLYDEWMHVGRRNVFKRRWTAKETIPKWVERWMWAVCGGVHKTWDTGCNNGCQQNCTRHWKLLESWGRAILCALYTITFPTLSLMIMIIISLSFWSTLDSPKQIQHSYKEKLRERPQLHTSDLTSQQGEDRFCMILLWRRWLVQEGFFFPFHFFFFWCLGKKTLRGKLVLL